MDPINANEETQNIPTINKYKKFEKNGNFSHYPGNNILCMVPRNSPQFRFMGLAQQLIRESAIGRHFIILPPSSLHMTVYALNSTTPPGLTTEQKNAYWREENRKIKHSLLPIMVSSDWTVFRMKFEGIKKSQHISLKLGPATPKIEHALSSWRSHVHSLLSNNNINSDGNNNDHFQDYIFHCTLAYVNPGDANVPEGQLKSLKKQVRDLFRLSFGEIEMDTPRLTRYHDLSEYLPMHGDMDVALFLAYNNKTYNANFAHLFEFGLGLETRHEDWQDKQWSHFVPFVFEGETYYIAYSTQTGRLHVINVKSAHVTVDILQAQTHAGFTHCTYVMCLSEPLAVFYNSTSNLLLAIELQLSDESVALYFETTLKIPGGGSFTHLIECGDFLLGYSATTGVINTFQIVESNNVFIEPVARVNLDEKYRGLSLMTSLSTGFTPSNARAGQFLIYNEASGKTNVLDLHEGSTLGSVFETSLEPGLTAVVPARFCGMDYITTYHRQTEEFKVYKVGSNMIVPISQHYLPNLSHLFFLDRMGSPPT